MVGRQRGDRNRQSKKQMNCEMQLTGARAHGRRSSQDLAVGQDGLTLQRRRCKHVISRRLREKQAFLSRFSVVRELISRQLRGKRPFFSHGSKRPFGASLSTNSGQAAGSCCRGGKSCLGLARVVPGCPGLSRLVPHRVFFGKTRDG
jgi:hypothetical protein